jgi:Tol biopolymer transport system component
MPLAAGTRLGAYEITALLGAGGMGEVYRARDTRLQRDVALKILPELVAADPERLARFRREAQLLASLNHPNIAAIYGLEEPTDVASGLSRTGLALVLELVDGPTLTDLIDRRAAPSGPAGLPLDEALSIARQIAEALEAAHEQGIVHRDLKPANIKVRPDGTVKVLDFGLAKAFEAEPAAAGLSMAPTITSPAATRLGTILGTAAYMSPEQARGKVVDKRTDIWAFGCVLYEMLTAKRAFEGEEVTDVLARVLEREPDLLALPSTMSPAVMRLLRRCLEKDRRVRLPDIGVARLEIDEALAAPAATDGRASVRRRRPRVEQIAWAGAVLASAVLAATALYNSRATPTPMPELRLQVEAPRGPLFLTRFAISPDGRSVVFRSAQENGRPRLWLRLLGADVAQPLPGTEAGLNPFWSADGRAIGFVVGGELKRLDVADGRIQTLTTPAGAAGGAWNDDGTILFTRSFAGPLYRIPAAGGEVTEVTRVEPPRTSGHVYPQFLPDGRHFLFYAFGSPDGEGVYIGSLDSPETHHLLRADSNAVFAPPDLILYAQEGALVAQRIDLQTWELTGEPMTVARQVAVDLGNGLTAVAAASAGTIGYRAQPAQRQLAWIDRTGARVASLGDADTAQPGNVQVAPDGRAVALSRTINGNTDIWLMDATRATRRRFTLDASLDTGPLWSPDGSRVVFASDRRAGNLDLYEKPTNAAEGERVLLESAQDKFPNDWSPDGRFILYRSTDPTTRNDLWALPLFGDQKPLPVAETRGSETFGQFSRDGRWVAYQSDESGRPEIYVQPFPGPGAKIQISSDGGSAPEWRADGRELFFVSEDRLMAVSLADKGTVVEPGTPTALFPVPEGPHVPSADGQRFLVLAIVEEASPITILLNWAADRR